MSLLKRGLSLEKIGLYLLAYKEDIVLYQIIKQSILRDFVIN